MSNSTQPATSSWRFKIGIALFTVGHVILLGGVLLPAVGINLGAQVIGGMVLGGELMGISSIVFLGKDGFMALKSKLTGAVQAGYAAPIGPARHYIGLLLFLTNVLVAYFIVYYAWVSFGSASPEMPMTEVWGLGLAEQWEMLLTVFLVGEIAFLVSLYVLGADWWERFRNVFVWHPTETRAINKSQGEVDE